MKFKRSSTRNNSKGEVSKTNYKISSNLFTTRIGSFFKSSRRGVVYTKRAKEIMHSFKDKHLFKEILELSKKIGEHKEFDPIITIKNSNYILTAKRFDGVNIFNCRKTYTIEFRNGNKDKLFIKDGNIAHTIFEHLALNYMSKLGFNIVEPIFSYTSKSHNYIVYDYSHLSTLDALERKLSPSKFRSLSKEVLEISKRLYNNRYRLRTEIIKEMPFIKSFKIAEIKNTNVFYDKINDKLYFFDPVLDIIIDENKLPDKKYISNLPDKK